MYQLIRETRYYTPLDFVKRCQTNLSMQRYVFIVRETISFRLILLFPLWNHQHHSLLNSFLKFAQLQLEALNSNFQQKTDYINLKRVWSFPINWNVLVFQKVFIHVHCTSSLQKRETRSAARNYSVLCIRFDPL